jgi:hypothetical protein
MSSAGNRAVRAGIREGAGNGMIPGAASAHPTIPTFAPQKAGIVKRLQGRILMKKAEKQALFETFFNNRAGLLHIISQVSAESAALFGEIPFGNKLKKNADSDFLGSILYQIYEATPSISPLSANFDILTVPQKDAIRQLHDLVNRATQEESIELNNQFSNCFISVGSLPPGEYDRHYLVDGYLPVCVESRKCITCDHPFVDEPNTNKVAQRSNEIKKTQYDAQVANDLQVWAQGGTVHTTSGTILKEGRTRPQPSYQHLIYKCHCAEFSCSSDVGVVPKRECPIQCIDETTGQRFGIDENGMCLCHICACSGCPQFYTVRLDFCFIILSCAL